MGHTITAHMQSCKVRIFETKSCNDAVTFCRMEEQSVLTKPQAIAAAVKAINGWRERVLSASGLNAKQWADKAKVAPTNITRGMAPEAESVTKIETLHMLARAVGVPSPVDFFASPDASVVTRGWCPSRASVEKLMASAMHASPGVRLDEDELRLVAHVLHAGLAHLSARPAKEADEGHWDGVQIAMLEALKRFREMPEQAA